MGAPNLRVVTDTIELDAPEHGLDRALEEIAHDLQQVSHVRRDVKSWALYGAALSSSVTVLAITGLFFAFMPGPPPPAIVIQPTPVAVVVAPPALAAAPLAVEVAAPPPKPEEQLPNVSELDLAVRRAFSALWASRPKKALLEADEVLAAAPDHVDALAARALALYDLKRDRAARATVKKALKLDPRHPLANVLRGTMAQVDHDVPSALAHYDKYLHQRPHGALAEELAAIRQNISPK